MKKNNQLQLILLIAGVVVLFSMGYWYVDSQKPGQLDNFAKCLNEKGAKFYGAYWCPHCQAQKALFGKSKQYLPYIECSTADGKGQVDVCKNAGVESYPTWMFAVGSTTEILKGEQSLETLSGKTGCTLPEEIK